MSNDTCVLIHGFTGSPAELEPLGDALEANGYEVVLPILAGHGGTKDDLRKATASAWIQSVTPIVEDLLQEGRRVHLIGFSAGAMIAAIVAAQQPVDSVTMLAPAVYYNGAKQTFHQIADLIKATWNSSAYSKDYLRLQLDRVIQTPLKSVQQLRRLVTLGKAALPKVTQPVCVLQGEQDDVVEPRGADFAYHGVASQIKELYYLPNSGHLLCHEADCQLVQNYVLGFLSHLQFEHSRRLS